MLQFPDGSYGRTSSTLLALLLLIPLAALGGCDEFGDIVGGDESTVEGTWVNTDGEATTYLEITSTTLTGYESATGSCFRVSYYDITAVSGDTYTLQEHGTDVSSDVILRAENGRLSVREASAPETDAVLYDASSEDPTTLEECTGSGGGDPSIDCGSLPAIAVGQSISGELSPTDDIHEGYYYDLYGLTLGSEQQVTIGMTSTEIDTYLYLYESDGTYIDEDDDSGEGPEGTDSSLTATLQAGCYRIEASSWGFEATGAYTLSVD